MIIDSHVYLHFADIKTKKSFSYLFSTPTLVYYIHCSFISIEYSVSLMKRFVLHRNWRGNCRLGFDGSSTMDERSVQRNINIIYTQWNIGTFWQSTIPHDKKYDK